MSTQHFESESIALLRQLKARKEALQHKHAVELSLIDKEIDAVSTTVRLLREAKDTPELMPIPKPTVIPSDLSGKSAREACIEIAKKNGGLVRVAEAKDALVSAGILKASKNTWAIVYTTLKRSNEFEKTGATGVFRLVADLGSKNSQASFLH